MAVPYGAGIEHRAGTIQGADTLRGPGIDQGTPRASTISLTCMGLKNLLLLR